MDGSHLPRRDRCAAPPTSSTPASWPPSARPSSTRVAARYAVAITPAMAELIERADHADPIARQFVPDAAELATTPDERADPIGDAAHTPVKGIVHRYPDRVLLKPNHACAGLLPLLLPARDGRARAAEALSPAELDAAMAYIARAPGDLGGDRHRRRSADPVAAAAGGASWRGSRDRPCQGRPLPHPRAGRRSGADHAELVAALKRLARQPGSRCTPTTRANSRRGARGAARARRRRHPDGRARRVLLRASTTTRRRWRR